VKPDNILVNLSPGPNRFSDVKLADFGDCMHVDAVEEGHLVGAPIFRSPEGMLNLRWGTATDIWSFGTTVASSASIETIILTLNTAHQPSLGRKLAYF
jgi:casein kinase II subunit alpha